MINQIENVEIAMYAAWGRPTPCQSLSALITTLVPSLKSLNQSAAVLIAFLLLIRYVTLWPWHSNFELKYISCDLMKLCAKFESNRAIRGGVIAIWMFDLMTLNMFPVLNYVVL